MRRGKPNDDGKAPYAAPRIRCAMRCPSLPKSYAQLIQIRKVQVVVTLTLSCGRGITEQPIDRQQVTTAASDEHKAIKATIFVKASSRLSGRDLTNDLLKITQLFFLVFRIVLQPGPGSNILLRSSQVSEVLTIRLAPAHQRIIIPALPLIIPND
jgi:hypothetical protein